MRSGCRPCRNKREVGDEPCSRMETDMVEMGGTDTAPTFRQFANLVRNLLMIYSKE